MNLPDFQEMLRNLPFDQLLKVAQEWSGPLGAIGAGIFKFVSPFAKRRSKDKSRLQHVHEYTENYSKSGDFLMEAGFAQILGKMQFSANEIRLGMKKAFPTDFFRVYADCQSHFVPKDRILGTLTPNPSVSTSARRGWGAALFFALYLLFTIPAGIAFSYGLPAFYKASDWGSFLGTIVVMTASACLGFSCINQARRIADVTRVLEWPEQPNAPSMAPEATTEQFKMTANLAALAPDEAQTIMPAEGISTPGTPIQ